MEFRPRSRAASRHPRPLRFIKSLTTALLERYRVERDRAPFASLGNFYERTRPTCAEMLNLIRAGAFDGFGEPRTAQFWHLQHLAQWPHAQGYLFQSDEHVRLSAVPLTEPDHAQRLRDETELLGFTVSGHPLKQFPAVAWDTYCPIRDLARYPGERVTVCGLIIADRSHHLVTGDQMKFITLCDYTGIIECEIFAQAYRRFGLVTVRHPVVELEARVTPFESGLGCTLEVLRVGKPRNRRRKEFPARLPIFLNKVDRGASIKTAKVSRPELRAVVALSLNKPGAGNVRN